MKKILPLLSIFFLMISASYAQPVTEIKVNNLSNVTIDDSTNLKITISLATSSTNLQGDYFIWVKLQNNSCVCYEISNTWKLCQCNNPSKTYQGNLINFSNLQLFNFPGNIFPEGNYEIYFAVDEQKNGLLDNNASISKAIFSKTASNNSQLKGIDKEFVSSLLNSFMKSIDSTTKNDIDILDSYITNYFKNFSSISMETVANDSIDYFIKKHKPSSMADAYHMFTTVLTLLGNYDVAYYTSLKAVMLSPDNETLISELGVMLNLRNDNENSLKVLKKGLEINPNYSIAMANIARTYYDTGKTDKALYYAKKAVEIDPYANFYQKNLAHLFGSLSNSNFDNYRNLIYEYADNIFINSLKEFKKYDYNTMLSYILNFNTLSSDISNIMNNYNSLPPDFKKGLINITSNSRDVFLQILNDSSNKFQSYMDEIGNNLYNNLMQCIYTFEMTGIKESSDHSGAYCFPESLNNYILQVNDLYSEKVDPLIIQSINKWNVELYNFEYKSLNLLADNALSMKPEEIISSYKAIYDNYKLFVDYMKSLIADYHLIYAHANYQLKYIVNEYMIKIAKALQEYDKIKDEIFQLEQQKEEELRKKRELEEEMIQQKIQEKFGKKNVSNSDTSFEVCALGICYGESNGTYSGKISVGLASLKYGYNPDIDKHVVVIGLGVGDPTQNLGSIGVEGAVYISPKKGIYTEISAGGSAFYSTQEVKFSSGQTLIVPF